MPRKNYVHPEQKLTDVTTSCAAFHTLQTIRKMPANIKECFTNKHCRFDGSVRQTETVIYIFHFILCFSKIPVRLMDTINEYHIPCKRIPVNLDADTITVTVTSECVIGGPGGK